MKGQDEDGNEMEIEGTLADFIVLEAEHSLFPFEVPTYRKIMEEYERHHHEGVAIDHNYFVNYPDGAVSEVTVDFITTPYMLSNWERHFIYVHQEIQALLRSATAAVHALQLRRLEVMLSDLAAELREEQDYEKIIVTMQKMRNIEIAKTEFAKKLGRVVVK